MATRIEKRAGFETPMLSDRVRNATRRTLLRPLPCSIFAAAGIFGGISSLFVGLACIVIHAVIPTEMVFDRAGTFLLVVAIPMILIGSVFLDEIRRQ